MRRYPSKATEYRVSLESLHSRCSCVQADCRLSKRIVLALPQGTECLRCDACGVFKNKKRPDYIIYAHVKGYRPQWIVVEAKRSVKAEHGAVGQIQEGLRHMTQNSAVFDVRPKPQALLGLLVHERKKIRTSDIVLSRNHKLEYGGLDGRVQLCPLGTDLQDYMIPT